MQKFVYFTVGRLGFVCLSGALLVGCAGEEGSSRTSWSSNAGAPSGGAPSAGSGGVSSAAGGSSATAGGSSSGGNGGDSGGTAVDKCATKTDVSTSPILDFEDGVGDGTMGFYVYADSGMAGGSITPASNDVVSDGVVAGGADDSAHSFSFTGAGFGQASYGAGLGVWMNCRDASSVDGVRFYVKSDVDLMVTASNPVDNPTSNGGECVGDFSTCAQNGKLVPAASSWTLVSLAWSDFTGGKPIASVDPSEIDGFGIAIQKPTDAEDGWGFTMAIDQIEWLGAPEPVEGQGGATGAGSGGEGGA